MTYAPLKENPSVHRLDDLAIRSGNDDLTTNADLLAKFKLHERVAYDEKTKLFRYKAGGTEVLS